VTAFIFGASAFVVLSVAATGQFSHDERDQALIERHADSATTERGTEARDGADAWLDERINSLKSKTDRTKEEQEMLDYYQGMRPSSQGPKLAPL
jgi:hypothetical protein|tara:strand:+ start:69993 stop:70277 length:285 start_codon:yes stop_codon:yes gene_type:complete